MNIPYRTRRVLNRLALVLAVVLVVSALVWLCWVIWLQRYVVYSDEGVWLDFEHSSYGMVGQEAKPPVAEQKVSIFFNEGADAIDTVNELTQLEGYYITSEMFKEDMATVLTCIERLPAETPVMIDMKGSYGSFFYQSNLPDAVISQSTDIPAVANLVNRLKEKGFYLIARISSFQDYSYGNTHVTSGLYMLSRAGLWMDKEGAFWLDPTNTTALNWIASVVMELKGLGFHEVLLDDFRFPDSDQYIFTGDKDAALQQAAVKLMEATSSKDFTLSFCVTTPAFTLPEGRCRIYLEGVDPTAIATKADTYKLESPEVELVFLTESADTRYEEYGVLRSLMVSEEVEARKGR